MHDAGWNQPQNRFAALNPYGVSGVMAALKTHHAMRALGEPIDHFAFAFIAPLSAHDNDITTQSVFQRLALRLCAMEACSARIDLHTVFALAPCASSLKNALSMRCCWT